LVPLRQQLALGAVTNQPSPLSPLRQIRFLAHPIPTR
jgi:hypothetical protein